MVNFYVNKIRKKLMSIENVPMKWRQEVIKALED